MKTISLMGSQEAVFDGFRRKIAQAIFLMESQEDGRKRTSPEEKS